MKRAERYMLCIRIQKGRVGTVTFQVTKLPSGYVIIVPGMPDTGILYADAAAVGRAIAAMLG